MTMVQFKIRNSTRTQPSSLRPARLMYALLALLLVGTHAQAEQKVLMGAYEVHYIVIPTTTLNAKVADRYGLVRAKDRALVNISVIDADGKAHAAQVSGRSRNLLEQSQTLQFQEVREGSAIYYLALLHHADEEHHRIEIDVATSDRQRTIAWQQKMYWEES